MVVISRPMACRARMADSRPEPGPLTRTFEPDAAGTGPANDMALHIRDADESIVEGRQNVGDADRNILGAFGFDDFLAGHIVGEQFGGGRRSNGGNGRSALGRLGRVGSGSGAFDSGGRAFLMAFDGSGFAGGFSGGFFGGGFGFAFLFGG